MEPTSSRTRLYVALGTVAFVIIILVTYYFYTTSRQETPAITGQMLLTLRTKGDNHVTSLFTLDAQTGDLRARPHNGFMKMTEHVAPSGGQIAFTAMRLSDLDDTPTPMQVYRQSLDGTEVQVTKSNTFYKRNPEWSPDGTKIAFMARPHAGGNATFENNWNIYVTDLSGNEVEVGEGMMPQWFPDGKRLLALGTDGLYVHDLETATATKVWALEGGESLFNMKIDLSKDGSQIAWTLPGAGKVYVFAVDSTESFSGHITHTIDAHAFWAIFSEDGEKLALQEVNVADFENNPQSRVTVYDLATLDATVIKDLTAYDQEQMFITDWR